MKRIEKYTQLLGGLSKGNRNSQLVGIARAGRLAGVTSEQIEADLHTYGDGTDPLTAREVQKAIAKAEELVPLGGNIPERGTIPDAERRHLIRSMPPPPPPPPPPTAGERIFFETFRDRGKAWLDARPTYGGKPSLALRALSPVRIPREDYREQAALMVEVLSQDFLGYTFAAKEKNSLRNPSNIYQAEYLAAAIRDGSLEIPQLIGVNQLTGGKSWVKDKDKDNPNGGHWSWGTKAEILHYRHAVIEFDGYEETLSNGEKIEHPLPLDEQALFWLGIITAPSGPLLDIRSLTYSGSKSIHAVIRLRELRDLDELSRAHYATLGHCTPDELTDEKLWVSQWKELERLLSSSTDPLYHCDRACKDCTRMTRLAGHLRKDKGRRQALLYISRPDPRDLPRPEDRPLPPITEEAPQ